MTISYVVDPETGKLLTAQEWKKKAGNEAARARMVAIVPADGSPAFAMPTETFQKMPWKDAMDFAKSYVNEHPGIQPDGFLLPTRKQGIDIRMAREAGLDQLLKMIGASSLLEELRTKITWTCEEYVPGGTSEVRWSCVRSSSDHAWFYDDTGMSISFGMTARSFSVRPVTLLKL